MTVLQFLHIVQYVFLMFTIVCLISKCPKIQQDKNLSNFLKLRCQNNGNLEVYDFLQKLKKVVRIVLYGPAISQSDCRKAGPYQFPYNNTLKILVPTEKFSRHFAPQNSQEWYHLILLVLYLVP